MTFHQTNFVAAAGVRRALVGESGIRAEVEFQNDINGILARIDDESSIIEALGVMHEASDARPETPRNLRIIRGGATSPRPATTSPQFLTPIARSA